MNRGLAAIDKQFTELGNSVKSFGSEMFSLEGAVMLAQLPLAALEDISQELWKLSVTNPLQNWLTGGNAPTVSALVAASATELGSDP
jgi:hypothetical protein